MEKKTAEKAKKLLNDLSKMEEIRKAMKEEEANWWSFISPVTKRFNANGLEFPESFRKKFSTAVGDAIAQIEKELKEL